MKNLFLSVLFYIPFTCVAQVKEDFNIKSDFVDTLVTGYENWITIETKYDLKKMSLTSEKAVIAYNATQKKYSVKVSPGNKYVDLIVGYKKSDGSVLNFSFTFRVVPLSTEMINRVYK
jgi:hypothetical protein